MLEIRDFVTTRRFRVIAGHELRTQLSGALFWVLLSLVLLVTSILNPVAMIPSGDAEVGCPGVHQLARKGSVF